MNARARVGETFFLTVMCSHCHGQSWLRGLPQLLCTSLCHLLRSASERNLNVEQIQGAGYLSAEPTCSIFIQPSLIYLHSASSVH